MDPDQYPITYTTDRKIPDGAIWAAEHPRPAGYGLLVIREKREILGQYGEVVGIAFFNEQRWWVPVAPQQMQTLQTEPEAPPEVSAPKTRNRIHLTELKTNQLDQQV